MCVLRVRGPDPAPGSHCDRGKDLKIFFFVLIAFSSSSRRCSLCSTRGHCDPDRKNPHRSNAPRLQRPYREGVHCPPRSGVPSVGLRYTRPGVWVQELVIQDGARPVSAGRQPEWNLPHTSRNPIGRPTSWPRLTALSPDLRPQGRTQLPKREDCGTLSG